MTKITDLGLYDITIDFENLVTNTNSTNICYKEGDVNTAKVRVKLVKKEKVIDLTGVQVVIRIETIITNIEDTVTIVDAKEGIVEYSFSTNALVEGINKFELMLIKDKNVKISPMMAYKVLSSIEDDYIESSNEYPILIHLISQVEGLIEDIDIIKEEEVKRIESETLRREKEQERIGSESSRITNENTREESERLRTENEEIRKTNENIRIETENERIASENTRINNENIRLKAEETRVTSENVRLSKENERISKENDRVISEGARKNNEIIRNEKEEERIANEKIRKSSISNMKQDIDNKIENTEDRMQNIENTFDDLVAGTGYATINYVNDKDDLLTKEINKKAASEHTHTMEDIEGLNLEASSVNYDNSISGLVSNEVQGAIDEVNVKAAENEISICALQNELSGQRMRLLNSQIEFRKLL